MLRVGLVLCMLAAPVMADCPPSKRIVFDPPTGKSFHVPRLTHDGKGYALVAYDGQPSTVWLTVMAGDKPRSVKLFPGAVAASATDGEHIGIVYVVDEPLPATPKTFRYQTYFTVVGRDGKVVVPKVALGDKTAPHSAPGPAVVWNAQAKEWGVL